MTDRGVSEVIGFVLVFSLITMTIGVVYATGFTGLQDAQRAEQLTNMERAFDVFGDNVEDVYRREAPSRATEIKLADGSLEFLDPVRVSVYAENTSEPTDNSTFSMTTQPIAYVDGDTRIVYTAGAVTRSQSDGSVMLSAPDWTVSSRQLLLPFVETYQTGSVESMSGGRTVLVSTRRQSHGMEGTFEPTGGDAFVNVTVETDQPTAWRRYLESEGFTITRDRPDLVSGTRTVGRLYVPEVRIGIEFNY